MKDINDTVAANIAREMKKHNTKQIELAEAIGVTKQIMSKMLNGTRLISIAELKRIASYFDVSTDALTEENPVEMDVIRVFSGKVETDAARKALETADRIADMIIFHAGIRTGAEEAAAQWEI